MKVHVLTIGDEILIGQIIDTNSSWIAQRLNLIGMKVSQMKSISDELMDIKSQLQLSLNEVDVVIITGGLGPTKDDITKKALAEFLNVPLVLHEETQQFLIRFFTKIGRDPNTMDLVPQAQVPENTATTESVIVFVATAFVSIVKVPEAGTTTEYQTSADTVA